MFNILLKKGANIEATDDFQTPLHIACENGHLPIVQYLIEKGAKIDVFDGFQQTPLHYASENNHNSIAQYLIKKGAKIEITNQEM